jgi:hypothetical protein
MTGMPENVQVVPAIPPTHQFDTMRPSRMLVPCDIWLLRSLSPQGRLAKVNQMVNFGQFMTNTEPSNPAHQIVWDRVKAMMTELLHHERMWYTWFKHGTPAVQTQKRARLAQILRLQAMPTPVAQFYNAPAQQDHHNKEKIATSSEGPSSTAQNIPRPSHSSGETDTVPSKSPPCTTRQASRSSRPNKEVTVMPSSSQPPMSPKGLQQADGLAPTTGRAVSPTNLSRERKAIAEPDGGFTGKKAQIEERKAALLAQAKADDEEYEYNSKAIEAFYLKGDTSRRATDPRWQKMGVWRLRIANTKPQTLGKAQLPPSLPKQITQEAKTNTSGKAAEDAKTDTNLTAPKVCQGRPKKTTKKT